MPGHHWVKQTSARAKLSKSSGKTDCSKKKRRFWGNKQEYDFEINVVQKLTCFARLSLYLKFDSVEEVSKTSDSRTCSILWTTSENELP